MGDDFCAPFVEEVLSLVPIDLFKSNTRSTETTSYIPAILSFIILLYYLKLWLTTVYSNMEQASGAHRKAGSASRRWRPALAASGRSCA
jgi:hypothetical protein